LRSTTPGVIKHRAPNGALRRGIVSDSVGCVIESHKAPSTKRCIKTCQTTGCQPLRAYCHKAPSAKRCIKTIGEFVVVDELIEVIKHRAPNGALRLREAFVISVLPS